MARDRRKKGCPNTNCVMNQKKYKYKADDSYCIKCGDELVYVCEKCFSKIEDEGSEHRKCAACEAKRADRNEKTKGIVKKGAIGIGGTVATVGTAVFTNLKGSAEREAVTRITKGITNAVKTVLLKK